MVVGAVGCVGVTGFGSPTILREIQRESWSDQKLAVTKSGIEIATVNQSPPLDANEITPAMSESTTVITRIWRSSTPAVCHHGPRARRRLAALIAPRAPILGP